MDELIQLILSTGTPVVVTEETVLGGVLKRPLVRNFVAPEGTVTEIIEYAEDAQSRAWGAINQVNYSVTTAQEIGRFEVQKERKGGHGVIEDLIIAIKGQNLTAAEITTLLNTITLVLIMLLSGHLQGARVAANNTSTTALFTNARKTWLVDRIDEEIAKM